MTKEEFIEGFAAGKRKALVIPQRGIGWAVSGRMDYLCDTVVTLPDKYYDYGDEGILICIDGWMLDERDLVRFVDDE